MIVTVAVVRMVQVTIYKIVDMIAMRDRFVAATRAMDVSSIMSGAAMVGRAAIWVVVAHLNAMFVHVICVRMVKMAIVEIIHVVAMPNGDVAAIRSMYVVVVGMMRKIASAHLMAFPRQCCSPACATVFSTNLRTLDPRLHGSQCPRGDA